MQKDLNIDTLKVMPGKILGEVLSNLETSAGGIIMASRMKEIPAKAKVLKLGSPARYCNCPISEREKNRFKDKGMCLSCNHRIPLYSSRSGKEIPWEFKVGDILYFKKGFGFKWKTERTEYIFLTSEEITGVDDNKVDEMTKWCDCDNPTGLIKTCLTCGKPFWTPLMGVDDEE